MKDVEVVVKSEKPVTHASASMPASGATSAPEASPASKATVRTWHDVAGVRTECLEAGAGRPVLFLQPLEGVREDLPWFGKLANQGRVIAPSVPGFGRTARPATYTRVDDLAYFCLDLADKLQLESAVLMGSGFGGWIAAEIAVRNTARFSQLVLIDSFGVKLSPPAVPDIADIYALGEDELDRRIWHDPAQRHRAWETMDDETLLAIAQSHHAQIRYGWQPYMHNPGLAQWLHRIGIPTLVVWGESDGIVKPEYGRGYAAAIPGALFEVVPNAGHYPHLEQPDAFMEIVSGFLQSGAPARAGNKQSPPAESDPGRRAPRGAEAL